VEVKGIGPTYTWEIVGIYRAPNEDIRVIESLVDRTGFLGNSKKRCNIGDDLTLILPALNYFSLPRYGALLATAL